MINAGIAIVSSLSSIASGHRGWLCCGRVSAGYFLKRIMDDGMLTPRRVQEREWNTRLKSPRRGLCIGAEALLLEDWRDVVWAAIWDCDEGVFTSLTGAGR